MIGDCRQTALVALLDNDVNKAYEFARKTEQTVYDNSADKNQWVGIINGKLQGLRERLVQKQRATSAAQQLNLTAANRHNIPVVAPVELPQQFRHTTLQRDPGPLSLFPTPPPIQYSHGPGPYTGEPQVAPLQHPPPPQQDPEMLRSFASLQNWGHRHLLNDVNFMKTLYERQISRKPADQQQLLEKYQEIKQVYLFLTTDIAKLASRAEFSVGLYKKFKLLFLSLHKQAKYLKEMIEKKKKAQPSAERNAGPSLAAPVTAREPGGEVAATHKGVPENGGFVAMLLEDGDLQHIPEGCASCTTSPPEVPSRGPSPDVDEVVSPEKKKVRLRGESIEQQAERTIKFWRAEKSPEAPEDAPKSLKVSTPDTVLPTMGDSRFIDQRY